jgi:ATP-dependent Zn protease
MKRLDRRMRAYHEAGHAVVSALRGILRNDSAITIVPDGKGEYGSVSFSKEAWNFECRSSRYIRKIILALYAGPAVTKKLCPRVNLLEEGGECESDMIFAEHLMGLCAPSSCEWIGDSVFQSFKARTWKRAVRIVESNWSAITVVAKELLKCGTVTGAEVKRLTAGRRLPK